jgi:hypothetical protein
MADHIVFIVDNSSSVLEYSVSYLNAINSIIQVQKNINPRTLLTLSTFNEYINNLYINFPVEMFDQVRMQDLSPVGLTALYDNVSVIINKTLKTVKTPSKTIAIILTDGHDTCSRKVSEAQTALQILIAKTRGWQFIFLGVSEFCISTGRKLGCDTCVLYSCTQTGIYKIPEMVENLLKEVTLPNVDIDIRDLCQSMENTKIN